MELTCVHHPTRPARARCVECGTTLCGACRVKVGGCNYCRTCVPEHLRRKLPGHRSPVVAAVLAVVPGLGQMYAGSFGRGLVFMLSAAALAANLRSVPDPVPLFLWVFNLFDAFAVASERNAKLAPTGQQGAVAVQRRFWGLFALGIAAFCAARTTIFPDLNPDLLWPGALAFYGVHVVMNGRMTRVRTA